MDAPNLADHSGGSAQRSSGPLVLTDAIELIADPRTSQHGASGPPSSATNDPQDQPRSISPVPSYRTYRSRADTFTQQNAPDRAIQQSSTHLIPLTPIKWTRPTLSFIIQNNPREFTYLALLVFILVATMSGWIVFMVLVPGAGLGTAVGADGPNFNTTNQAISIFGLNGLNDNIADSDFNDPFDDIDSADILETGLSGGGSLRRRRDEPPDSDSSDENDGADSGDLGNTALLSVNAGFLLVIVCTIGLFIRHVFHISRHFRPPQSKAPLPTLTLDDFNLPPLRQSHRRTTSTHSSDQMSRMMPPWSSHLPSYHPAAGQGDRGTGDVEDGLIDRSGHLPKYGDVRGSVLLLRSGSRGPAWTGEESRDTGPIDQGQDETGGRAERAN